VGISCRLKREEGRWGADGDKRWREDHGTPCACSHCGEDDNQYRAGGLGRHARGEEKREGEEEEWAAGMGSMPPGWARLARKRFSFLISFLSSPFQTNLKIRFEFKLI
jgi:hypothetical protein